MARYGNTTPSSLMSSIAAAKSKLNAVNDQSAALSWAMSAQTQDDYNQYKDYLQRRSSSELDPSKKLSIQSKLTSAQSGFTSNEVQRQSMRVLEGGASNTDKYNTMYKLYQQAVNSGDMNLAQNLASQMDGLSKTIQDEALTAQNKAAAAGKKATTDGIAQALKENAIAHDSIITAVRTGKPLTDEHGNVIKGRIVTDPKTGTASIQLDPNGGPIHPTASQAAQATAVKLMQEENIYNQAIGSGLDENGTYSQKIADLHSSPEYIKYTNPTMLNAIQNGASPFTNKVDAYGNMSPELRTPSGWKQVQSPDGHTMTVPVFATGLNDNTAAGTAAKNNDLSFNRRNDMTPAGAMDNYTVPTAPLDAFNRTAADPVSGRQIYTSTNPNSIINPGFALETKNNSLKFGPEDAQAGKPVGLPQAIGNFDPTAFTNLQNFDPTALASEVHDGGQYLAHAVDATPYGSLVHKVAGGVLPMTASGPLAPALGLLGGGVDALTRAVAAGATTRAAAAARQAALWQAQQAQARTNLAAQNSRVQAAAHFTPPSPKPVPATPVQNIMAAAPRAATPQGTVLNQVSRLIDVGRAAAPPPAPPKVWYNPFTWFK